MKLASCRSCDLYCYIFEVSLVFDFFDFGAFDFFDFVVFVVSCEPVSCAKTGIASEHARAAVNNSVNSFFMTCVLLVL